MFIAGASATPPTISHPASNQILNTNSLIAPISSFRVASSSITSLRQDSSSANEESDSTRVIPIHPPSSSRQTAGTTTQDKHDDYSGLLKEGPTVSRDDLLASRPDISSPVPFIATNFDPISSRSSSLERPLAETYGLHSEPERQVSTWTAIQEDEEEEEEPYALPPPAQVANRTLRYDPSSEPEGMDQLEPPSSPSPSLLAAICAKPKKASRSASTTRRVNQAANTNKPGPPLRSTSAQRPDTIIATSLLQRNPTHAIPMPRPRIPVPIFSMTEAINRAPRQHDAINTPGPNGSIAQGVSERGNDGVRVTEGGFVEFSREQAGIRSKRAAKGYDGADTELGALRVDIPIRKKFKVCCLSTFFSIIVLVYRAPVLIHRATAVYCLTRSLSMVDTTQRAPLLKLKTCSKPYDCH